MQVNLSWTGVAGALFYRIYRGTSSGGPYQLIGQSNPTPMQSANNTPAIPNYQDGPGNLPNGIPFYYTISTVTADGESPYSVEIAALPPTAPGIPTGGTAIIT